MKHSMLTKGDVANMLEENKRVELIGKMEEARRQFFEGAITSEEYVNAVFAKIAEAHNLVPTGEPDVQHPVP